MMGQVADRLRLPGRTWGREPRVSSENRTDTSFGPIRVAAPVRKQNGHRLRSDRYQPRRYGLEKAARRLPPDTDFRRPTSAL
jgi:hypothetical protein